MEVLESMVWYGRFVPILCTMEFAWTLEKKVRLKDATMSATMREVSPDAVLRI
jgi:hypothetical protein